MSQNLPDPESDLAESVRELADRLHVVARYPYLLEGQLQKTDPLIRAAVRAFVGEMEQYLAVHTFALTLAEATTSPPPETPDGCG